MLDERNDTIDFSSGEPVHTHGGSATNLSSGQSACPAVYKYAYLMDQASPHFGRQTTTNPFAWKIRSDISNIDPSVTAYRVRDRDGAVLLDWTPTAPDADGMYSIELYRDGDHPIRKLGTEANELHLEMRFRTTAGAESLVSTCWNNIPMAAPLAIAPVKPGALFAMTLPANSPLSPLINQPSWTDNVGVEVATFSVTQQTAEATPVTIAIPQHSGSATGETLSIYLPYFGGPDGTTCPTKTTGACANLYASNVTRYPIAAVPLAGRWMLRVLDDQGTDICHTSGLSAEMATLACVIPARGGADAPQVYRVSVSLAGEQSLAPPAPSLSTTSYGEHTLQAVSFTGSYDGNVSYVGCGQVSTSGGGTHMTFTCAYDVTYYLSQVLNTARVNFDAMKFVLTTNTGAAGLAPAYLDAATLALPAQTWDGGTEGL